MTEEELLNDLISSVIDCDAEKTKELVKEAIDGGIDPLKIVEDGLAKGIRTVGDRFGEGELFLPDLIMASEAMNAGLEILEPHFREGKVAPKTSGKVVLGTVEGDLHDIGKKIVAVMLEANGFQVKDLGVDIPAQKFIDTVREEKPDILGLSALLTSTLPKQREVIEALKEAGIRDTTRVIVGGAPVTENWAKTIGADAYGADAFDAVEKAKLLLE